MEIHTPGKRQCKGKSLVPHRPYSCLLSKLKPIRQSILLLIILLVLASINIFAEAEEKKSPKPKKNWFLAVKGGITLNAGNTESQLISGGVKFALKKKKVWNSSPILKLSMAVVKKNKQ